MCERDPLRVYPGMSQNTDAPDVVDHGVSDVLAEDEVVHVPPAVADLVESQEHGPTFLPEVPDWDAPPNAGPPPAAA
jgi:hypothetical protein